MKKKSIILLLLITMMLPFLSGCVKESSPEQKDLIDSINSNGLVGYWRFDEEYWTGKESEIIDSSGQNNHGSIFETSQVKPGKIGEGFARFDGIDDYIVIKNSESLEPSKEITVETWVRKTGSNPYEYLISKGAALCDFSSYAFYTDVNGGLTFYVSNGLSAAGSPNVNSSIWDGSWHHIAGTFDGYMCRMFVDGEEILPANEYNLSLGYNLSTQNDLYIGAYNGSCFHPFQGDLDEVFIWNFALNETEIFHHYQIGKNISQSIAKTSSSLSGLKEKIRSELSGLKYDDLILIKGSNLSAQEELLMFFAQQQLPNINEIESVYDSEISNISEIKSSYQKIIFLGGNQTNKIVKLLQSSEALEIEEQYASTPFLASFGTSTFLDADFIIFSTGLETTNLENKGPERSPLSQILDKRLTPIVATIASITIIHVANLFGSTVSEFFFDFTSEKLGDRKKKKHQFKKRERTSKTTQYLKEFGSILIAIIIFSLSLSWTWSTDFSHFYSLFYINLFVVSIFYFIREGLRIYYSRKYSLNTEHMFWPLGSILTFLSTFLGNTFSLASYTALENEEKEKRYSKMYFTIFSILFGLTIFTFIINVIISSQMIQMFYVFTIMAVFIDMTPIEPMDGYEVKKYHLKKWIALYIPVFIFYVIIMFSTLL
jgi:hypothetical protein